MKECLTSNAEAALEAWGGTKPSTTLDGGFYFNLKPIYVAHTTILEQKLFAAESLYKAIPN